MLYSIVKIHQNLFIYSIANNLWNVSNWGLLWIKLLCALLNMSFVGHMHSLFLGLGLLSHEVGTMFKPYLCEWQNINMAFFRRTGLHNKNVILWLELMQALFFSPDFTMESLMVQTQCLYKFKSWYYKLFTCVTMCMLLFFSFSFYHMQNSHSILFVMTDQWSLWYLPTLPIYILMLDPRNLPWKTVCIL